MSPLRGWTWPPILFTPSLFTTFLFSLSLFSSPRHSSSLPRPAPPSLPNSPSSLRSPSSPGRMSRSSLSLSRCAAVSSWATSLARRNLSRSQNPEDHALVSPAGIVTPVSDGTAVIRAEIDGRVVETPVAVKSAKAAEQWSFRHDVQAVLTKSGCNMGACHGAQSGKKGFKLALRGYDSPMDYKHTDAAVERPPREPRRSGAQPDPAKGDGNDSSRRRGTVRRRQPRVPHRFRMDRRRRAAATR